MAPNGVGVQMCYRRVCGSTTGYWSSNNPVLAISFRRCRTTTYTSSVVPCFTNRLLSPRPFESRLVVRLGVICPELRPTQLAIPSGRDTAHAFTAHGSPSLVLSQRRTALSVSIRMTFCSAWNPRTVSLPLSVQLSTVLPRLILWLLQRT